MVKQAKILYVDDEEDIVSLASSFFQDESLHLDTSTNFLDALKKVRENSYDIIISDSRMPTGSGRELISMIRKEKIFKGKFILVTGNLDFEDEERGLFDLVLYKPLKFQVLIDHVKSYLLL